MKDYITNNKEAIIEELKQISSVQAPSRFEGERRNYIKGLIHNLNDSSIKCYVDDFGNLLVTKGLVKYDEFYPCIVSHLDTVHSYTEGLEVVRGILKSKNESEILCCMDKTNKFCGGVGDDSNGVAITLQAIRTFDILKAVFFVGEESGATGSYGIDLDFFNDCGYILEGDRKGSSDLIFDYCGSPVISKELIDKAQPIFTQFNYKKSSGIFTDVMVLFNRGVGISVFNFSVGYYNAHTDKEYTVIDEYLNSMNFALNFIGIIGNTEWICSPKVKQEDGYEFADLYEIIHY